MYVSVFVVLYIGRSVVLTVIVCMAFSVQTTRTLACWIAQQNQNTEIREGATFTPQGAASTRLS